MPSQLSDKVFLASPPPDYTTSVARSVMMTPDYGAAVDEARAKALQREAMLLKYRADAEKARMFAETYGPMRAAQIANLGSQVAYHNAQTSMLNRRKQLIDEEAARPPATRSGLDSVRAMIADALSEGAAPTSPAAPAPTAPAPAPDPYGGLGPPPGRVPAFGGMGFETDF